MVHLPRALGRAALAIALLAAAACADRSPTALPDQPQPVPPPSAAAVLTCSADVRAGTMSCVAQGAATGASAAIMGGQGTNVRLRSSGTSYDGTSVFRSDVAVENLTAQALATLDGVTPSPDGVRVFFQAGPTVTGGSGSVEVANADGEAAFTAAGQKYFRYAGILAPGDTTPAREWRFTVPSTVTTFSFALYVAAEVRVEEGWIELSPVGPSLVEGDTQRLAPVVHGVSGRVVPGQAVAWATSDTAVATVDSLGLVTARARGAATITATSAGRGGSVQVRVTASWENPAPTVVGFEVPARVTADGVDSLRVRIRARSTGTGVFYASLTLQPPGSTLTVGCNSFQLESGTPQDGVFRCATTIPDQWRSGLWRVVSVIATGPNEGREVAAAALLAAGVPVHVNVRSPNEDTTAPVVWAVTFSADSITAGEVLTVRTTAIDGGVGAYSASMLFRNPASGQAVSLASIPTVVHGDTAMFVTSVPIPAYMRGGPWVVERFRVTDRIGNFNALDSAGLRAGGFPTAVRVSSPAPDTVAPAITGFSLSVDSLAANGVDAVTAEMSATDEYSGLSLLQVRFRNLGTDETRNCEARPPRAGPATGPSSHTFQCELRFGPSQAGTWQVSFIRALDYAGNARVLDTAAMQAVPYPTELIATP